MSRIASGFKLYRRPESEIWWVSYTLGGKRGRKSTGKRDRAEAERAAAAIVFGAHGDGGGADGGSGSLPPQVAERLDLKQLSDAWIEKLEKEHPGNRRYVNRIETDMLCYVERLWMYPHEITSVSWGRTHREGVQARLHGAALCEHPACIAVGSCSQPEKHGAFGPLKWRSIAHLANTLRHFLRYCASRGVIESVPEIKSPPSKLQKAERAPRSALDDETKHAFLWALLVMGEERACRIYLTLFETWMRKSSLEALTLRWCDFKAETITIPAAHNKSGVERVIDMTPAAVEAIRAETADWKPIRLDKPVFGAFDFHQAFDATRKGGVFGRALALAGIDRYGLTPHHSTRHTAATIAGAKPGASLSGLMAQAGWESAQMAERYLHPTLKAARALTRAG